MHLFLPLLRKLKGVGYHSLAALARVEHVRGEGSQSGFSLGVTGGAGAEQRGDSNEGQFPSLPVMDGDSVG